MLEKGKEELRKKRKRKSGNPLVEIAVKDKATRLMIPSTFS